MEEKKEVSTEVLKLKAELCDLLISIEQAKAHIQAATQKANELMKQIELANKPT